MASSFLDGARVQPALFAPRLIGELDTLLLDGAPAPRLAGIVAALSDLKSGPLWSGFLRCVLRDAQKVTLARQRAGKLRAVGGTTPIITLDSWRAAERLLGVDAQTLVFQTYYITGAFDIVLKPAEDWFGTARPQHYLAFRWLVFLWALMRFDSFYFFNDAGVLPSGGYGKSSFGINAEEMQLIRQAGKALYTLAYGADYRTRSKTMASGRWNFCIDCPDIGRFCLCDDAVAERIFSTITKHATAVLGAGLSLKYLPNVHDLDYVVLDVHAYEAAFSDVPRNRPLRIVHVPNHPHFKGTRFLVDAVARLKAEGLDIDLRMLTGVGHEQVIELMKTADIVADQFIGGSFGQTAVEAMALGKPVLCYVRADRFLPEREQLPLINTDPDRLYATLRSLATNPQVLPDIARRSRAYVAKHYSVEALSARLDRLYREISPFSIPAWPVHRGLRRRATYELRTAIVLGRWRARNLAGRLRSCSRRLLAFAEVCTRTLASAVIRSTRQVYDSVYRILSDTIQAAPNPARAPELDRDEARSDRRKAATSAARLHAARDGLAASSRRELHAARDGLAASSRRGLQKLAFARRVLRARAWKTTRRAAAASTPALMRGLIWLARTSTRWRLAIGRPRTLWGITPILTLPLLARADRALGFGSASMVFVTYYISSHFDINLKRISDWIIQRHPLLYPAFTKAVLAWALLRYDVFHYFCDRGILLPHPGPIGINEHEMDLIRRSGKRLFTYTYGADVRTRQATLALGPLNFCMHCPSPGRLCICDDEQGRDNIATIARYANGMAAMGDMKTYVPLHLDLHFWPIDVSRVEVSNAPRRPGPLRVAHAPNHPHFKGTPYLEAAIARLQSEGVAIELIRVQGVPNERVLELFRDADVVAEQFIGGFHGYTALEAMALAKPVLAYIRSPELLIDAAACPIVNTSPDSIYDVLRAMAEGKYDLPALGRRGRAFVQRYYSVEAVAIRLADMYVTHAGLGSRLSARIAARARKLANGLENAPVPERGIAVTS